MSCDLVTLNTSQDPWFYFSEALGKCGYNRSCGTFVKEKLKQHIGMVVPEDEVKKAGHKNRVLITLDGLFFIACRSNNISAAAEVIEFVREKRKELSNEIE